MKMNFTTAVAYGHTHSLCSENGFFGEPTRRRQVAQYAT